MTENKLPVSSLELKKCFSNEEFVIKTCQQIDKDLAGLIEDHFEFDIDFEEDVLQQMVRTVAKNLKNLGHSNLLQFVYKVDLNEKELKSNLNRQLGLEDLAFKIIRREAQKIFLRLKFG